MSRRVAALAIVALLALLARPVGFCLMDHVEAAPSEVAHHHGDHRTGAPADEVPERGDRCPDVTGCALVADVAMSAAGNTPHLAPLAPSGPHPDLRPAPISAVEPPPPRA